MSDNFQPRSPPRPRLRSQRHSPLTVVPDNTSSVEYADFVETAANVLTSIDFTKHERKELKAWTDETKAIQARLDRFPEALIDPTKLIESTLAKLREREESIEKKETEQEEMLVKAVLPFLMAESKVNGPEEFIKIGPNEWRRMKDLPLCVSMIHVFVNDPAQLKAWLANSMRRKLNAQRQDGPDKDQRWNELEEYVEKAPLQKSREMEERSTAAAQDEEQSQEPDSESDTSAAAADEAHIADGAENEETEERRPLTGQLSKEVSDQLSALLDRIVANSRGWSIH